jgi:hypothetical protein
MSINASTSVIADRQNWQMAGYAAPLRPESS